MTELPAIELRRDELTQRIERVRGGMSPSDVKAALGGGEVEQEKRADVDALFWRFRLLDADDPRNPHELYMGEFREGRLLQGFLLPRGSA